MQLLENCKNIDVGEYERMKDDLHQLKVTKFCLAIFTIYIYMYVY